MARRTILVRASIVGGGLRHLRRGFTLVEVLAVIAIMGILTALLLPAVQHARETSRRMSCQNNLKQLGIGVHQYHDVYRVFPPGGLVTTNPQVITVCWTGGAFAAVDVIGEAASGPGLHGTSWMLRVLPYVEQGNVYDQWNFQLSVFGNRSVAERDIPLFYCPSRRTTVKNRLIMFGNWSQGGNDYGGCIGGCNGWHNCGRHESWVVPDGNRAAGPCKGIFGVRRNSRMGEVTDGASNTVMLGEVQRLDAGTDVTTSRDGWAVGGVSTHFSTCSDGCKGPNSPHFEEPGSHHVGGAFVAMADGSIHFVRDTISTSVLMALGSMGNADGPASF